MIERAIEATIAVFETHGPVVAFLIVMILLYVTLLFFFKKTIERFLKAVESFRAESEKQRLECTKEKTIMRELYLAEKTSIIKFHHEDRVYLQEERKQQREDFIRALEKITHKNQP